MKTRVAYRLIEIEDFFISAHNRGKLVNSEEWQEYEEAKQIYKAALAKFKERYKT